MQVASYDALKKTLEERLAEYNESNAVMSLVLFQQAMEHVCRIARIIELPRGNAMLVGVGGSGKQSLARLASFICGYDVFQIAVSSTYGVNDFKENLLQLYTKAGMKGQPVTFLLTDNQIVNEKFLVFLNDLLSTGLVSDLCAAEDVDNFSNSVRAEVKAAGILETPESLWDFFIEKIRKCAPCDDRASRKALPLMGLVQCAALDCLVTPPSDRRLRDVRPRQSEMDIRGDGQRNVSVDASRFLQRLDASTSTQTYVHPGHDLWTHDTERYRAAHDKVIWEELKKQPTHLLFPNVFPNR